MSFSIDQFVSELNIGNVSRLTHFTVLVSGPPILQGINQEYDMTFRCDAVTEPGRTISMASDMYHYGLHNHRASGSEISTISLTIILSEDHREREYFERWQDLIVGNYRSGQLSTQMYDLEYYDNYVGTMQIYRYDDSGVVTRIIKCKEVFPIDIGDIELAWDNGNNIARLTVKMQIKYYINEDVLPVGVG